MPFHTQFQVLLSHSITVISDGNKGATTFTDSNINFGGLSVNCIFHQFLQGRCGSLNDFSSGDLINELERRVTTRQPPERILTYYSPILVNTGMVRAVNPEDLASGEQVQAADEKFKLSSDVDAGGVNEDEEDEEDEEGDDD